MDRYDAKEHARLTAERASKFEKRTAVVDAMRTLRESDTAWDDARHSEFRSLRAEEEALKSEATLIDERLAVMDKLKAQDRKAERSVFDRWMRRGDNGLTAEEITARRNSADANAPTDEPPQGREGFVIPFGPDIKAHWTAADADAYEGLLGIDTRDRINAPTYPGDTGLSSTIEGQHRFDLTTYPLTAFGGALHLFTSLHVPRVDANGGFSCFVAPDDSGLATGPTANLRTSQTENSLPDTWDKLTISAQMYTTGFMDLSRYLKEDVQFDVTEWAMKTARRRVGRKLEQQAANGTGATGLPRGFMTASADYTQAAGGGAVFRWGDAIDIMHAIDEAYLFGHDRGLDGYGARSGKTGFVTSWQYLQVLQKLQDADNRPLIDGLAINFDFTSSAPDAPVGMLFGWPVYICSEFTSANQVNGNDKKPIVFGNFGQMVQVHFGEGLMIERFYDSATALNNTERFMGRFRWGCGIVGPYDGTKNTSSMKSKGLRTLKLTT